MSEPQYKRCHEVGNIPMGVKASQLYQDDPKMLGIVLARYKFVSKMLAGKKEVAEIGCGDGFFSRVVHEEVGSLDMYDFDESFISDARSRGIQRLNLYNILFGCLKREYDAIYSLDVIEHINPEVCNNYLENIRNSLKRNGVFIVGLPSLESQAYASEQSKVGHVNCMSGGQLKEKLQEYYTNVFLFSMNDEVIHTGFSPMAHYLMAICAC